MSARPASTDTGENPCSSAAANRSGLKADPGCRRLRVARLNCDTPEVTTADHGEQVAVSRVDGHQRGLELRFVESPQPVPRPPARRHPAARAESSCALPSQADDRRRTPRGTAGGGTPSHSRRADPRGRGTARSGCGRPCASRSCASVMNPSSRMRASTTWLRCERAVEIGPRRERRRRACEPGDRARTSARFSVFAGLPNRCCDIVSTP